MVTLETGKRSSNPPHIKHEFWRRQFRPDTTGGQVTFDVVFGIVAPVLCFVFDPIVFKDWIDRALFPQYQSLAYMISGSEILLLTVWLTCGRLLQPRTRLIGGVLAAGALFSVLIGLAILPYTLIGLLIFFIGVFGFVPFLTGFVYLRNASRAFQMARNDAGRSIEIGTTRRNWSVRHRWIDQPFWVVLWHSGYRQG